MTPTAVQASLTRCTSAPVLRLYRWDPPCLSLGFAQGVEAADRAFCAARGIDVVRRPTGGRAVLHHLEQTYCVCAPLGAGPFSHDLQAAYRTICGALVAGLRGLGVPAELSGSPEGGMIRPTETVPCFVGPASGEVVVSGRKLLGSAARRVGDTILQHGALLEDWNGVLQAGCLGLADDHGLRPAVVTLADVLGEAPLPSALSAALVAGFGAELGAHLVPSGLSAAERARAELLERERHAHGRWLVRRDRALPGE